MFCEPGSLLQGIPTQLNNVNLIPQLFESDEEYPLPHNYELKRHDVLCGQVKSPGNERFRIIAEMRVQRYLKASCRRDKVQIVSEMVDAVRQAGGNFVRLVETAGDCSDGAPTVSSWQWMDIGNLKAREKASHALRCIVSRYQNQKSTSEAQDVVAPPAIEQSAKDERPKSRRNSKRNKGPIPTRCPEPPKKKVRTVSNGSTSSAKNMPGKSKDHSLALKEKSNVFSLNDIILFQSAATSSKAVFHDLRSENDDVFSDSKHRDVMLPPIMELSMASHMIPHSPSMKKGGKRKEAKKARDSCFWEGVSLQKYSLVDDSRGLVINDEDLMDLFDFNGKEAIV